MVFPRPLDRLLALPEANLYFFGFLVNYPWEFLQAPFFTGMMEAPHWSAVRMCTIATFGDAGLVVVAYWITAAVARSRTWLLRPRPGLLALFLLVGEVVTIFGEWHATEVSHRWSYGPEMATLPLLGTGVAPFLQWLLLPLLVVGIAKRQLAGVPQRAASS